MTGLPLARGVLLDLDGTLFDTAPDLIDSINTLRAEQQLSALADAELAASVGHGSAPMIARAFNLTPADHAFEPLRLRFLDLYRERLSLRTRPYEGMEALLHALEARAIPWGIVTNKPGWLTRPLITALGYDERPHCLVTGDDMARRKPHPHQIIEGCRRLNLPANDCVTVGDTERDIIAGRQAGTLTLAALYGYVSGDDRVERWGADGLISHPLEVLRWLHPTATAVTESVAV
ncbi:MAG: HAD-IA family hydrolase [Spiribacter sp.]|jgi:haloacid dehalogenase superfamily, subfamily IA, variant 3 with third motif having DD or ED/haloacid dehalogenase superfamily, subfamily IA, variant 1 with third motif having Dx(3-4)D or Dx(3-4)E|nr:HAD-IA family hydrolase [Spiribacter sp.]MDR9479920.1 HAD-IA family hydrolase [Spiribacter sp.]